MPNSGLKQVAKTAPRGGARPTRGAKAVVGCNTAMWSILQVIEAKGHNTISDKNWQLYRMSLAEALSISKAPLSTPAEALPIHEPGHSDADEAQ
mmetsp:Transcript_47177/g.62467  ORF Transcript_47177/g.62467 Transcript_47177/m.62467 type:complete len:94 (-) Transcript_47177:71-352(-)